METRLESSYSHASDGTISDQMLRDSEDNARQGNSARRSRNNCQNFKLGNRGATNVDSDTLNQNGEFKMNTNTDVNLEAMQVKVDSNEKVINAGLAGHKAELAGHKAESDGKFVATLERIDGNFKSTMERVDGNQKAIEAKIETIRSENKQQCETIRRENKEQCETIRRKQTAV